MNQEQVLAWAQEAGFAYYGEYPSTLTTRFERFAALVAAHEREKFLNKLDGVSEKVIYETVKEAVLAEREACAKVCEQVGQDWNYHGIAAAIRARGDK